MEARDGQPPKPLELLYSFELDASDLETLAKYDRIRAMAPVSAEGDRTVTLKEIDLYLSYYPVYDVYYFIDLMFEIDRQAKADLDVGN